MARILNRIILICVAAGFTAASASAKESELEKAIKSQLLHNTFTTKILIGSFIACPHAARSDAFKMIDTELSPDGSIKYLARANCFFPHGFILQPSEGYVSGGFAGELDPGSTVWVRGVDFKENRIEVRVSTSNTDTADGSGKIKYMLGPGYRSWTSDHVMLAIAQGLLIPPIEKLIKVNRDFQTLTARLQEAESGYASASGSPGTRLSSALALKEVLLELEDNRAEYASLGKSDAQAGVYAEKLKTLAPQIADLSAQVQQQQVAQLRNQLNQQLQDLARIQAVLRSKAPATLAEWQQRSNSLTAYTFFINQRNTLLSELQKQGEPPSASDNKYLSDCRTEIQALQQELQQNRQQLQIAEVNSQYAHLTRQRAQMLDAYSRAFATPREKSALQNLIAVLDQLISNRNQAAQLGDTSAQTQMAKYRSEEEKYKRR